MTIESFLTQLSQHCGVDSELISVSVEETDEKIVISLTVPEEDSGIFIGHHGDVIEALQRLIRIIFQDQESIGETQLGNKKITLNINDYREQRRDRLTELTQRAAEKVLQTGRPYYFNSYLPAHERFIIHSTLSELEQYSTKLESISEGYGRDRRLVIRLKQS